MKLPEFITELAPIGAVLKAEETGEAILAGEVKKRNARTLVETADSEGLSQWEADYGLPNGTGADDTLRRGRIRGAMTGGQTLTPERLSAMAVNVAGADTGKIREDFDAYFVELAVLKTGKLPEKAGMEALRQTLEQKKPAHLEINTVPCAVLPLERAEARYGSMLDILYADAPPLP
ncbi:hypothetical protein JQM68_13590 [Oscillibacter valericigenes]|uniref:hypothetical protein n=1 Tax=Oscillibacter valericigenes TaxID=351091 RepID=UPI001F3EE37B|nr:hypothetical protein [Oscillibacter valericigenes]MCF2618207.1 hypothetical protein [Oscillibacter valericigenes]